MKCRGEEIPTRRVQRSRRRCHHYVCIQSSYSHSQYSTFYSYRCIQSGVTHIAKRASKKLYYCAVKMRLASMIFFFLVLLLVCLDDDVRGRYALYLSIVYAVTWGVQKQLYIYTEELRASICCRMKLIEIMRIYSTFAAKEILSLSSSRFQ